LPITDAPKPSAVTLTGVFADHRGVDPALEDQVLDEASDRVVRQGGDHAGAQSEAAAQTAYDVVLAAALPHLEAAGGADAALTGVEAQHDLAEGDHVGHGMLRSTASAVSRRISA
jgi:hypothetical protein